jgi:hypothetical protein
LPFSFAYVPSALLDEVISAMPDAGEKTATPTRSLFFAFGSILLASGLGMMTEKAGIQLGLGLFLSLLGALCFYASLLWDSAKRALSAEAQLAIGRFAQSRSTWLVMIFLIMQVIIFFRFIEEHRWPFSYPADPAVFAERDKLQKALSESNGALNREKELADKWRFTTILRQPGRSCRYRIEIKDYAAGSMANYWEGLFQVAGWTGDAREQPGLMQLGITIRASSGSGSSQCAGAL